MLVDEQRSVAAGSPAQPVQGVPVMQGVPIAVPVIGANAAGAPPVMVAGPVPLSMSRAADACVSAGVGTPSQGDMVVTEVTVLELLRIRGGWP